MAMTNDDDGHVLLVINEEGVQGCGHTRLKVHPLFFISFFLLLTFSCRYLMPSNEAYPPRCICYCPPPPLHRSNVRRRGFLAHLSPPFDTTRGDLSTTTTSPSLEHEVGALLPHHHPPINTTAPPLLKHKTEGLCCPPLPLIDTTAKFFFYLIY